MRGQAQHAVADRGHKGREPVGGGLIGQLHRNANLGKAHGPRIGQVDHHVFQWHKGGRGGGISGGRFLCNGLAIGADLVCGGLKHHQSHQNSNHHQHDGHHGSQDDDEQFLALGFGGSSVGGGGCWRFCGHVFAFCSNTSA